MKQGRSSKKHWPFRCIHLPLFAGVLSTFILHLPQLLRWNQIFAMLRSWGVTALKSIIFNLARAEITRHLNTKPQQIILQSLCHAIESMLPAQSIFMTTSWMKNDFNIHIQGVNICTMIQVFKLRPLANVTTTSFSGHVFVFDCCCYEDWMSMQYEPASCKHLLCHYLILHACLLTTKMLAHTRNTTLDSGVQ